MPNAETPKFLSQADFARRRKVSRKAVTTWKSKGLLVLSDAGQVDVEATEWKLDDRPVNYRGGVTHRPIRAPQGNNSDPKGNKPKVKPEGTKPSASRLPIASDSEDGEADPAIFDGDAENLTHAEAVRRKENYLGLLRKRELEISNQEWVRIEDVGRAVEREYSVVRERLLALPGKLSAKLVDQDRAAIELALFEEIREALNELHDPDSADGRGSRAGGATEEGEAGP